jgi:hypothetical protein
VFLALARRLTEQRIREAQSLEALFAETRALEAEDEDKLASEDRDVLVLTASGQALPAGDLAGLWRRTFSGAMPAEVCVADGQARSGNSRVLDFDE